MIQSQHMKSGTGGIWTISGDSHDEVLEKITELKASIDYMRSPYCAGVYEQNGLFTAELRYYGLD